MTEHAAIATADAVLTSAGLPGYGELATLLRAAENKLAGMATYRSGPSAKSIEALCGKLRGVPIG
jgi:hypothetical protein